MRNELVEALEAVIGDLPGPTAVDGALDLDAARVYQVRSVILRKNDCPIDLRLPSGPVAIYNDEHAIIGFATVYSYFGDVVMDAAIVYSTPERLLLETGATMGFLMGTNEVVLRRTK